MKPTQQQSYKLDFTGKDIFSGIDAHLKSWKITIMIDGISCKTFSQDSKAKVLGAYLNLNYPGGNYYSAYEAGFCGFAPHRVFIKAWNKKHRCQSSRYPYDRQRKEAKR